MKRKITSHVIVKANGCLPAELFGNRFIITLQKSGGVHNWWRGKNTMLVQDT